MAAAKVTDAQKESALVEVEHNVEKAVNEAVVYIKGVSVVFKKGIASVTEDIAKELKAAGIAK